MPIYQEGAFSPIRLILSRITAITKKAIQSVYDLLRDPKIRQQAQERCGTNPIGDGIVCPVCDCPEVIKDGNTPEDTEKWFLIIRAFKVDNWSHCTNCNSWFDLEGNIECPECKGEKKVEYIGHPSPKQCELCDGKGVVQPEK